MSSIDDNSSIGLVREVARDSGGPAYFFFAPFLVPDGTTARALRRRPDVARAFKKIASVTKAVAGIGGRWAPAQSTLYDAAAAPERPSLASQGVAQTLLASSSGPTGPPWHTFLDDRMVAISAAQMKAIPEVIAIPHGTNKQPAVQAALRSGLVNSLVTPTSLATALLTGIQTASDRTAPRAPMTRHERSETPLHGGFANSGLGVRIGDTVRRPQRPTGEATHPLLEHLHGVGFDGAPRFLGVDPEEREVLSYIPGDAVIPPYPAWALTDAASISVAELLRR